MQRMATVNVTSQPDFAVANSVERDYVCITKPVPNTDETSGTIRTLTFEFT